MVILLSSVLAACGGGGGGGGGGNTGNGEFVLSATTASFTSKVNGTAAPVQFIDLQLTGSDIAQVGAAYGPGVPVPSWLIVDILGTAPNLVVVLEVVGIGLSPGNHQTTVTVGTADANGDVLKTRNIQVTYNYVDGVVVTTPPVTATATLGAPWPGTTYPVTVVSNNKQWRASSNAPWASVPGTTFVGTAAFNISLDPDAAGPGVKEALVTVTNINDPSDTATVEVALTVALPTLTLTPTTVVLGGASGLDRTPQEVVASLTTGANTYPWTATITTTNGIPWLLASVTSGTMDDTGVPISLSADTSLLPMGTYVGNLRLQATVLGETVTINRTVVLNVDEQRIVVSADGAAFSSFPSRQVLTRPIKVRNTQRRTNFQWEATTTTPWLTVTPSGTGASSLVLTADPTGLAPDQYYSGTVTVSSPDAVIGNQETITVGLVVRSADPEPQSVPLAGRRLATSPTRPEVYVTDGTAVIRVYDVYSGALLRTLPDLGTILDGITVSSDGGTLFVSALVDEEILVLDPVTGSVLDTYTLSPAFCSSCDSAQALAYARPEGHPILISTLLSGEAFDVATGLAFPTVLEAGSAITVADDGNHAYFQNKGTSPSAIHALDLRYSTLNGAELVVLSRESQITGGPYGRGNGKDLAISADGERLYAANGAPYGFEVLNPATLASVTLLSEAPYPAAMECGWAGFCVGALDGTLPGGGTARVYDAANAPVGTLAFGGPILDTAQLVLSGDNTRAIALVNAQGIGFLSVP